MTEKLFHKGWLYERDGVRFTPFVLKESIVDRKGQTGWADEVDVKLTELEDTLINIDGINSGEVSELKNRTKALEERVEYINASRLTETDKDEFYITNESGKVGFKVNDNGAHSSDFTIAREDKTISLYEKIGALDEQNKNIEDAISTIINDVNTNAGAIDQLDERTYYLNAEESDVFYITDGDGRIGLKVDNNGTTSYNFTTKKTDLNSLAGQTKEIVDAINFIQGDALVNLQEQIIKLDKKTKYMNASDEKSQAFYITDDDGYIAAIIDGTGITSFNFISHGVTDLNSLYAELVKQGIDIQSINDTLASVDEDISDLNNRAQKLELKTRYMNVSQNDNVLYVTDNVGRVIMKVDHEGIHSIEFDADGLYVKESIIELFNKNTSIHDILDNFNTAINALAQKTKYMNASDEEGTFYVADKEGRVGFKIDENGITYSGDFKIILDEEDEEGNKKYISLYELNDSVNAEIKDRQEIDKSLTDSIAANVSAIEGLKTRIDNVEKEIDTLATQSEVSSLSQQVTKHGEDIKALQSVDNQVFDNLESTDNRVEKLETRTQYINASQLEDGIEKDEFYIVDEEGFINFKVNEAGSYSSDFIIALNDNIENDKKEISLLEKITLLDTTDNELKREDQDIKDSIIALNSDLNKSIAANIELINDTKDELNKSISANTELIDTTKNELNEIITKKEDALKDSIDGLDDRIDITKQQIEALQSNSATNEDIKEINGAIGLINEHLGQHDEDIESINAINQSQTDTLNNINPRIEKLEKRTQYLNAEGSEENNKEFYIVNLDDGKVGFKVDNNGAHSSDFTISRFEEGKAITISLFDKIKDLEEKDSELTEKDESIIDSINSLNGLIEKTEENLNESIAKNTKLIHDTEDKLNKTIAEKEDALNKYINTNVENLSDSIKALDTRVDTTETDITGLKEDVKTLQSNSATNGDIEDINKRLNDNDIIIKEIESINVSQDDALNNAQYSIEQLATFTKYLNASDSGDTSAFYLLDGKGHIGFKVTSEKDKNISAVFANQYYLWSKNKEQIPVIGYEKIDTIEIE